MNNPQDLVASYLHWLKDNITTRAVDGDWVQISTPFLDRHNDYMQIYVKADGSHLTLSDDGYVLSDLVASGCDVSTPRRKELLEQIVRGFGVNLSDDELTVSATMDSFAQRKHSLLQAMVSVNDLFLTSRHTVRGLFLEELEEFLTQNNIRYVPSVQMAGRSGLSHTFDYVIPGWQKAPERILKAINNPTKDKVQSMLFAWSDIREVRKSSKLLAMVNDRERPLSKGLVAACEGQGVEVVPWSARTGHLATLSA